MRRRLILSAPTLAAACLVPAAVARADTAELANQFAAALTAHDIPAFAALFADDYINHQVSAAAPPPPPGKSMKQGTIDFFAARLTGIPDLHVAVEASVATAGKFAASFVYTGTHLGALYGIPPTGRALRFTSCDIFAVRDGRIVEHWGMGDIAGTLAQLKG